MLGSFEARHGFHHGDGGVVRLANDGGVGVAMHVVGQPLDAQLRTEAWNGYTCADPEETRAMLEPLYEKTDPGRAGEHRTEL